MDNVLVDGEGNEILAEDGAPYKTKVDARLGNQYLKFNTPIHIVRLLCRRCKAEASRDLDFELGIIVLPVNASPNTVLMDPWTTFSSL